MSGAENPVLEKPKPRNPGWSNIRPAKKGEVRNPLGRGIGSRNKLADAFIADVHDKWQLQGPAVLDGGKGAGSTIRSGLGPAQKAQKLLGTACSAFYWGSPKIDPSGVRASSQVTTLWTRHSGKAWRIVSIQSSFGTSTEEIPLSDLRATIREEKDGRAKPSISCGSMKSRT
jgi:hypothetical protein